MNDPLIGKTIGGCEIREVIGQGGMATVYRAHQVSIGRDVAVKVLPPEFMRQSVSLDRFKREATIVARLAHRAIVPIHDHGEHEGMPYMVMRLMDGGSVEELLAHGPVPPDQTLSILSQIAPALDFAHREGVLHRDLKPSNILLDANGDAYITDFGIARILGPDTRALTTTGVVGTPSYMSPEQAQGHELDGRSDVYALGVVLFEMLTGVRPFEGDTPYSVAVKHVTEPVPSACAINPQLPPSVDQVLYKALAKNRAQRFQTAAELVAALRDALMTPPMMDTGRSAETEPSLNQSLEMASRVAPEMPAMGYPYVNPAMRPTPPEIQVMPPYVSRSSPGYSGVLRRPISNGQMRHRSSLPSWLTWMVVTGVIGAALVAIAIGVFYFYYLDAGDGGKPSQQVTLDYAATAIFKLTATRQAIDTVLAPTLSEESSGPQPTISLTAPPTNTFAPTPG